MSYKQLADQLKKMSARNRPVRPVRSLKPTLLNVPLGASAKSSMSKKKK